MDAGLLKGHDIVLLAVSGGSDSIAMMQIIANRTDRPDIAVATVDHGLRKSSAKEADFVALEAQKLGLAHTILNWKPGEQRASAAARNARYDLLCHHALTIGASAVLTAHTLDDQAETVLMRSFRIRPGGATRGLSCIPKCVSHAVAPGRAVCILRPLLTTRRTDLQNYLTSRDLPWVSDPSNENLQAERVRVRKTLADTHNSLPDPTDMARLAVLSARQRQWLNVQTAGWLASSLHQDTTGRLVLESNPAPRSVTQNAFETLACVAGGFEHRPGRGKLEKLIDAFQSGSVLRHNVGRSMISVGKASTLFEREARNSPDCKERRGFVDGRFFVEETGEIRPFVSAFEHMRPESDNPLYDVLKDKLGWTSPTCVVVSQASQPVLNRDSPVLRST